MTNWNDVEKIRALDTYCRELGFVANRDPYDHNWSGNMSLFATEDLVIYNTDSPLCTGDVDTLINFLRGWQKAHEYLHMLGAATPKTIGRKRLDYRNKKLVKIIKGENNAKKKA